MYVPFSRALPACLRLILHISTCYNSCAAQPRQSDYNTVHLRYVGDESIALQGEMSQSTENSHVKPRVISFHQV